MTLDVVAWVATGLVTSVLAPALTLLRTRRFTVDSLTVPGAVALPGFVVLHGLVAYLLTRSVPVPAWLGLHVVLLAGAVLFWLPVFGRTRRLSDPLRVLYLFLSMMPLDLTGVLVIVLGDHAGGLAMIIAMQPAAVLTLIVTWRWVTNEEAVLPPVPPRC